MGLCAVNTFNNNSTILNFGQEGRTKKKSPVVVEENPISRKGEAANMVVATFLGGMLLAFRLFCELGVDFDFALDKAADKASKVIDKNKKAATKNKRTLLWLGAFASIIAAGCAGFALLYTIFKIPSIRYNSKVNTYKKSQDMDTYTKSNSAERELYEQLADKAKNATPEEREKLKEQYLKMRNAKNQVPDFVRQRGTKKSNN